MNALFQNVLTASFHGSIVILAVLVLRAVLKKTPKKFLCLLWLLAGIRLLMPFEIQSDLSLQPEPSPVVEQQIRQLTAPVINPDGMILPGNPTGIEEAVQNASPVQNFAQPEQPRQEIPQMAAETETNELFTQWPAILPYFWAVVASCFAIYSLYAYLRLRYQVREAVKIPGGWECDRIETAFILGFIKPRIYIPMGMSRENRRHILAHERTHLEKGDHWFKMIGFVALAIHWFNPLVWVAYVLLCKDIEMACDERVVQFMDLEERKSYSAALLSCSTNKAHFAACPVAFGEVSVKHRILSVLNYKKPGFWISLLGVAAIAFVAVCLVTSPTEEAPALAAPTETTAPEASAPAETLAETEPVSTFAAGLKQEDVVQVCSDAINELCSRESYLISRESATVYPEREDGSYTYSGTIRRYGSDALYLNFERLDNGEDSYLGSTLYFGDTYGMHYGDFWVEEGTRSEDYDINAWLQEFSPEGKTVTFPEGTGIVSDDSVSFAMEWSNNGISWKMRYSGIVTFTFRDDGTVARISRKFEQNHEDFEGEPCYFTTELYILEEDPAVTYDTIAEHAGQCIPVEQLEKVRREQEKITEIPSNKTTYDKDFMLGSGQMRWHYFDEAWQFGFGAENATAEGLTLFYCESGDDHKSLTAEEGFWIEQLTGGVWVVLDPKTKVTNAPAEAISVSWSSRDTLEVNWKDSYGTLDAGYYRLGRYHTAVMPDGRSETIHCYAKFRVYDPDHDKLLSQCSAALDKLLTSDSYHFYTFDWMTEHDRDYYLSQEVWKSGEDYLEVTRYPLREDMSEMWNVRGSLWRGGKHYGLSWEGEPGLSKVSDWNEGVDGYITGSNVDVWLMGFEWYDAQVEEVLRDGDKIRIYQTYDFDSKYECSELTLTIDDGGNLKSIVRAYLPTRYCADGEKIINEELVVFDTPAAKCAQVIAEQDVTTPIPFSYAQDVADDPDAQTSGFKNTTARKVTTAAEAIALADKECTLENRGTDIDKPYYQMEVSRDENAGIWKVELYWWQDDDCYQAIYMDDQGITRRIVTGRPAQEAE